ncbi:helix-turn-helix transcriptional regulator [Myxococcota bacterium]|nr:helix-turn-helix transcriptional regulator [Myxococcota bacterium]
MEIGTRIRELRKRRGWTIQDLADKVDLTKGSISNIERGIKQPSLDTLAKIAEVFSISPGLLLDLQIEVARLVEISHVLEKARTLTDEKLDLLVRLAENLQDA